MRTWQKWIIDVLYVLLPGFFYVLIIFILIYTCVSNTALYFSFEFKDYLFVLIISYVIISYIIGHVNTG